MRRVSSSKVAVVLAAAALFVSLGGPAWAAGLLVGTGQIKNRAVTSAKLNKGAVKSVNLGKLAVKSANLNTGAVKTGKIHNGAVSSDKLGTNAVTTTKIADNAVTSGKLADQAVSTTKLADNAVTSAKVADNSLTAGDVAPDTFLAANGTATDSQALGGFPASAYARTSAKRLVVPSNVAGQTMLVFPLGDLRASCTANKPTLTYHNASSAVNLVDVVLQSGTNPVVTTTNALGNGGDRPIPNTTGAPQWVELQAAAQSAPDRVMTIRASGQFLLGTGCVFIAQESHTS